MKIHPNNLFIIGKEYINKNGDIWTIVEIKNNKFLLQYNKHQGLFGFTKEEIIQLIKTGYWK